VSQLLRALLSLLVKMQIWISGLVIFCIFLLAEVQDMEVEIQMKGDD
jgi:hypothetical protein